MNLQNRTVVMSGNGRAVCRGIVLCLAKCEANIAWFGVDVEELETTAAAVRHRGCRLLALVVDMFSEYLPPFDERIPK